MCDDETPIGQEERPIFHAIDHHVNIQAIRQIKIADGTFIHCWKAERIHRNDENDTEVLNKLLDGALKARGVSLTDRTSIFGENLGELSKIFKVRFQTGTVNGDTLEVNNNEPEEIEEQNQINHTCCCCCLTSTTVMRTKHQLPIIYAVVDGIDMIALCISYNSYLYNLNHQLELHPTDCSLHFKLARYYECKAEQNNSFGTWQDACRHYLKARNLGDTVGNTIDATLGYCRCLVKLSKYKRAIKQLKKLSCSHRSAELWSLLAIACRKAWQISEAKSAITQCLAIEPNHPNALRQQRLLDLRLGRLNEHKQHLWIVYKEKALFKSGGRKRELLIQQKKEILIKRYQSESTRRKPNPDEGPYFILSVDGGGFRGLIPAIWLREIEKRTHRYSSNIFQMMAGTSTGAIIACGLSISNDSLNSQPAYEANEIVDLYVNHAADIFVPATRRRLIYRWATQSTRYSRTGREVLFNKYFSNYLICNCRTDIVVPAVLADRTCTYLFNRYDSRMGNIRPTRIVDVLMSTTAAPTYFRPHAFNYSAYVDGGVQMNNPTMAAYTEALRYGHKNIFVLSLGTGDYIHDPLRRPTANRHCCFWLCNSKMILKNLFEIEQNNIDYQINSILGNSGNYHRWQVWFEDEILLDQYNREARILLEDHANTFLDEMEERDDHKRLGMLIERLS